MLKNNFIILLMITETNPPNTTASPRLYINVSPIIKEYIKVTQNIAQREHPKGLII